MDPDDETVGKNYKEWIPDDDTGKIMTKDGSKRQDR